MNDSSNKPAPSRAQGLMTGLVVIAIGLYFLLRNLGVDLPFVYMHNWWALFILVAAVAPLTQALRTWNANHRFDAGVARPLLSALAIVTVALMFLLDLRWDLWWPVFVIYGGLWLLVRDQPSAD